MTNSYSIQLATEQIIRIYRIEVHIYSPDEELGPWVSSLLIAFGLFWCLPQIESKERIVAGAEAGFTYT